MAEPRPSTSSCHSTTRTALAVLGLAASTARRHSTARRARRHRRGDRRSRPRSRQHAGGAGRRPRHQHIHRRAVANHDQRARPVLHRVPVGGRPIPDRCLRDRVHARAAGLHLPRARPAPDRRFHADPGRAGAEGDHRHQRRGRRAHRPRPDHLRQHDRPTCRGPSRLHRAGRPLTSGHEEPQRRALLRGPARPVQQHSDRRHQQPRSVRSLHLRQRDARICRWTHRVHPRGGEGAPDRHRTLRCPLRQFRRRFDQRRNKVGLQPSRRIHPRQPRELRSHGDRRERQPGSPVQP